MDWSRIKSIFIIVFLILDLFLLSQYMTKYKTNQIEVKNDVSLEENLRNDSIIYEEFSKDAVRDQYMSANTKVFTEKEVADLKNQKAFIDNGTAIYSELKSPVILQEKQNMAELNNFIKTHVLYGDQYGFWNIDREAGTVTYYQKFKDKPFFMNRSAHLVFYMNDESEIEAYEQTMLEMIEPVSDQEEVFSAMRAMEVLYRKGSLKPDSKVIRAELGYYTLVNMEASQVLTPTWHFIVEWDGLIENLLVNAFEGQIIQVNTNNEKSIME